MTRTIFVTSLALTLLSACNPSDNAARNEVMETQRAALEKAKNVSGAMQQQEQAQKEAMEKQAQ